MNQNRIEGILMPPLGVGPRKHTADSCHRGVMPSLLCVNGVRPTRGVTGLTGTNRPITGTTFPLLSFLAVQTPTLTKR